MWRFETDFILGLGSPLVEREAVSLGREAWTVTEWVAGCLVFMTGDGPVSESGDTGQGQSTVL